LAFAAELAAAFPWVQTVFWFDEAGSGPVQEAARSMGIKRMIPLSRLADWLDVAIPHLGCIARARRDQIIAERALPPLPPPDDGDIRVPLPDAERRFREAYLRRMLSESENHTVAARKAGLAYTTLCSMLRKLNLK
jgi:hypothetical protein